MTPNKTMKLWIRKLSCGHERPTNLAFISGVYNKPRVGGNCYCRECCQESKIIEVTEADDDLKLELNKLKKDDK